ncbi:MAG: serine hydrolase domain-containing protein [Ignavibacteriaceae bacterium]
MNKTKAFIALIFTILIITTPDFAQNSLDSLIQSLPATCESYMTQRGWPGLSIAVVLDNKIIYSQAFGYADVDKKIPATTNTIYRVGSITKVFNATMLVQLAEKGIVNLDDPLIKYIPEYTPEYPAGCRPTTLLQLATHTSGLHVDCAQGFWHYYSNFLWVVKKGNGKIDWAINKDELIATLNKVKIEYTPTMYPNYSNFGFQLLGIALEKAANKPFEEYIKTNILEPLGMKSSGFYPGEEHKSRFAKGYVYLEPDFKRFDAPDWDLNVLKYSGGLYSTPEDIARFILFQFEDRGENDSKILSGDGLRRMHSPQTLQNPDNKDTYGIGWALYEDMNMRVIGHAGGHWGFGAKVEFLPDLKFGVVTMTNCNYPGGYIGPDKDLTRIIIEKFIPALQKKKAVTVFNHDSVDLNKYTGQFAVAGDYANAKVYIKDNKLYMTLLEKPEFDAAFLPVGVNSFCFEADPGKATMLRFKTGENNNITGLEFLGYNFIKK